jgi:hypothetical protein
MSPIKSMKEKDGIGLEILNYIVINSTRTKNIK